MSENLPDRPHFLARIAALEARLAEREAQIAALEATLQQLSNSWPWRLLEPARRLHRLVRRSKTGGRLVAAIGKIGQLLPIPAQRGNGEAVPVPSTVSLVQPTAPDVYRDPLASPGWPAEWMDGLEELRQSSRPLVLFISHGLGGGTAFHARLLAQRVAEQANVLLLTAPVPHGPESVLLRLPGFPHLAALEVESYSRLMQLLRSANPQRVYVHHWLGLDPKFPIVDLLHRLARPYDLHLRDFLAICPHYTLSYAADQGYCGELGIAQCQTCLKTAHLDEDIVQWRDYHRPLVLNAQRVFCASLDTLQRFKRYFPQAQLQFVPHEPPPPAWPVRKPAWQPGQPLRVAMIGGIGAHKGMASLELVAARAQEAGLELVVIGSTVRPVPAEVTVTGEYHNPDLPGLIERYDPHLFWFPIEWPETYCWTLSAAMATGLPIAATRLGSFGERLEGRPQTWLRDFPFATQDWLDTFAEVKAYLGNGEAAPPSPIRPVTPDFYPDGYLAPIMEQRE